MSKTYFNISDKLRLYEFDGMLDQYGDAAAAYSLRKLRNGYTGDAIRVRRSSDDTERDIGFYDNELDTVALLDWVNAEYIRYESDFSLNGSALGSSQFTITLGETHDGKEEVLKAVWDGNSPSQLFNFNILPTEIGTTYNLSFDFYLDGFNRLRAGGNGNWGEIYYTSGQWATFNEVIVVNGVSDDLVIYPDQGSGAGNIIYLKNIRVTQLTADGHVHTWYDQSANANHAVQGTDTAQPKIIDAGALVEEDGKAAVLFGTPTFMQTATGLPLSSEDSLISVLYKHDNLNNANVFDSQINNKFFLQYDDAAGYRFDNDTQYDLSQTGISSRVLATLDFNSTQLKSYFNGTNTSTQTVNSVSHTGLTLGRHRTTTINYLGGTMQEFVYWNTNNTNNSLAIQENINTHYNIY
jgi:hypothetical protein